MTQLTSIPQGHRVLDHDFTGEIGSYWAHGGCVGMVMRGGGGDQCGHSGPEHQKNWRWGNQRFNSADPAGQDFDFAPVYDPIPQHNPVNPILATLRHEWEMAGELTVSMWSSALINYEVFGGFVHWNDADHPYNAIVAASNEQRAHALAVLERYENLFMPDLKEEIL